MESYKKRAEKEQSKINPKVIFAEAVCLNYRIEMPKEKRVHFPKNEDDSGELRLAVPAEDEDS